MSDTIISKYSSNRNDTEKRSVVIHDHVGTWSSPIRPLFYMHSHLSALQSCALFSQPIFSFFLHLNSALHNLVIELCGALFLNSNSYLLNLRMVL